MQFVFEKLLKLFQLREAQNRASVVSVCEVLYYSKIHQFPTGINSRKRQEKCVSPTKFSNKLFTR